MQLSRIFGVRYRQRVVRQEIKLSGLPQALDGFTIGQLSDLHRGLWVSRNYIRKACWKLTELQPELIVLTGDYMEKSHYIDDFAEAISGLSAPHGKYAILGNHDYWTGEAPAIQQAIEATGVEFLTNRGVRIERDGGSFWLCGVDDLWAGNPQFEAALDGAAADEITVMLAHEPEMGSEAALHHVNLVLSGHTHGGQVRLWGKHPVILPLHGRKYFQGFNIVENSKTIVYTNLGLGVVFPPLRINCPPEITLLTLRCG